MILESAPPGSVVIAHPEARRDFRNYVDQGVRSSAVRAI